MQKIWVFCHSWLPYLTGYFLCYVCLKRQRKEHSKAAWPKHLENFLFHLLARWLRPCFVSTWTFNRICLTIPTLRELTWYCGFAGLSRINLWRSHQKCVYVVIQAGTHFHVLTVMGGGHATSLFAQTQLFIILESTTTTDDSPSIGTSRFLTRSILLPTTMTALVLRWPDCQRLCNNQSGTKCGVGSHRTCSHFFGS